MGDLKTGVKIGVLAEDSSDVDVIAEIIKKLAPSRKFSLRRFVGNGCGRLRNKCESWCSQSAIEGCKAVILVHDKDRNCPIKLRTELEAKLSSVANIKKLVVVPIEELEAWLMCDPQALRTTFNLKRSPKCPANPERITSPKEKLRDMIWSESGKTKRYVNTIHNVRIAKHLQIGCLKACSAFAPLKQFWKDL